MQPYVRVDPNQGHLIQDGYEIHPQRKLRQEGVDPLALYILL